MPLHLSRTGTCPHPQNIQRTWNSLQQQEVANKHLQAKVARLQRHTPVCLERCTQTQLLDSVNATNITTSAKHVLSARALKTDRPRDWSGKANMFIRHDKLGYNHTRMTKCDQRLDTKEEPTVRHEELSVRNIIPTRDIYIVLEVLW